jgi:hypothetical protein
MLPFVRSGGSGRSLVACIFADEYFLTFPVSIPDIFGFELRFAKSLSLIGCKPNITPIRFSTSVAILSSKD